MTEVIIALSQGLAFVLLLTFVEGCYYDYVYRHKLNHPDIHPILTCLRVLFLLNQSWTIGYVLEWQELVVFIGICLASFNFFHEGALYKTRNYFAPEIYKKKWWAEKHHDNVKRENQSKTNVPAWLRTSMFGLALIALYFLSKQL